MTMPTSHRLQITRWFDSPPEKVFKALRRKDKGEEPRFGPTRFPEIPWPEPTRVPPPWEGGDGTAVGQSVGRTVGRHA